MKGTLQQAGYLLVGILAMVALSGCPPVVPPTTVVTVSPDSADVEAGQTITLEADSNSTLDTTFAWTTSNAGVVAVDQTSGTSITIHAVAAGTATITATGSSSGEAGTALITVPQSPAGTIQPALQAAGLNVTITGVTIPADRKPEVAFTATNTKGQTIAKSELSAMRAILTHLEAAGDGEVAKFASYIVNGANGQATYDSGQLNNLTQLADGSFVFKFNTAIPAGYDASGVHQVGFQIARLYAVNNLTYPANPIYT
ncbi:MAG: Ig-like domain-containing protein, partial [FCB group bacterium]|nr:Ig-like domain-containing protein [FCB group bacterium]